MICSLDQQSDFVAAGGANKGAPPSQAFAIGRNSAPPMSLPHLSHSMSPPVAQGEIGYLAIQL